jgi:hypothetical protein
MIKFILGLDRIELFFHLNKNTSYRKKGKFKVFIIFRVAQIILNYLRDRLILIV